MAAAALQTRPEPMNASPYHSKVRVTLKFADSQFAAGGMVTGKIELECKAEKGLGIGVIMVELFAIEELTSRDHSATSTFLHSRRLFQGPGLPPSNSVHPYPAPGDPPLPSNYYHARRGITTFFFQFPLPDSSPSSIDFGSGLARLRYEVTATVGVAWKGEKKLVTDKKQLDVLERLDEGFNRIEPEGVVVGENGRIWIQGKVLGGFMVAGEPTCIELQVKNHSNKKNSGLSVSLTRELYLPNLPATQKQPLQLSDTVTSVSFRGPEYIIPPGAEGVANLVVDVPKNARGVKGGRRYGNGNKVTECLFEVRCTVGIKLAMGIGSKDIRLDLPVTILHPAVTDLLSPDMYAISPTPMGAPVYDPASGMLYQPPTSPTPYLNRPMSPYTYPVLPMSPPIVPYTDQGQVWLPAPAMPLPANDYAPTSYYAIPTAPHSSVVPFQPPPRPSSAEPMPSQPLHSLPVVISSAVPPPHLIPMPTGGKNDGDREEGRGERASRISHHLRMSSRHRSASPPAHRYHLTDGHSVYATNALVATPMEQAELQPQNKIATPSSSPELHAWKNLTLSPLHTGGSVVSPRPMLSPKLSYSKDPFEQVTQVANLERIAAQEEGQGETIETSQPIPQPDLSTDGAEKTLPKPPVPSGKEKISAPRGKIDTLFPPDLIEAGVDETPPTPTLAAITSLKVPRGLRSRGESSGLDALEARLLAEVGTRKPEKNERPPDVRKVLPIAIPRPTDVEPPVDSAISSLTLGGLEVDADDKTLKRGGLSRGGTSDREFDPDPTALARGRDSKETVRGRDSKDSKSNGGRKKGDKHSSKQSADAEGGPNKDKELQKLRKAAQGRITAWLGSIDPEVPPQLAGPPPEVPPAGPPSPRRGRLPVVASKSPARSPAPSPARSARLTPEPPAESAEVIPEEIPASQKQDARDAEASPNPRSSGFVAIGTARAHPPTNGTVNMGNGSPSDAYLLPKASPHLAVYPPRPLNSEVKYDVRSARGGKGGIVTSVAAIWASATQSSDKEQPIKPVSVKPRTGSIQPLEQWRATTERGTFTPASKPKRDELKSPTAAPFARRPDAMKPMLKAAHSSAAVTSPRMDPMLTTVTDTTAKRARMIKSTSDPAVVSSSTATPMISSTASLARPSPARMDRTKLDVRVPPTISEVGPRSDAQAQTTPISTGTTDVKSPGSPPAKSDYAFGQARLRELIKRYQGQVNIS